MTQDVKGTHNDDLQQHCHENHVEEKSEATLQGDSCQWMKLDSTAHALELGRTLAEEDDPLAYKDVAVDLLSMAVDERDAMNE